jgi:hypothetical protein
VNGYRAEGKRELPVGMLSEVLRMAIRKIEWCHGLSEFWNEGSKQAHSLRSRLPSENFGVSVGQDKFLIVKRLARNLPASRMPVEN